MRAGAVCLALITLFLVTSPAFSDEYVVKEGDSLRKIAQCMLGDAGRWKEIAEVNRLEPPYMVRPDQVLAVPAAIIPKTNKDMARRTAPGIIKFFPNTYKYAGWPGIAAAFLVLCLLWWLFFSICIRTACWFSLVNASIIRCTLLALFLSLITVFFTAVTMILLCLPPIEQMATIKVVILVGVILAIYFSLGILLTKKMLDCKWRSIVTVSIMTSFVTNCLITGLMLGFGLY